MKDRLLSDIWGLLLLFAVLCMLALGASSANAATPVLLNTFGIGSFAHPTGVTVDQSGAGVSGNVLVADGGSNERVDLFGPEGGAPLGGLATPLSHTFDFGEEPAGVAIDNSGGPSNGDLYVDDVEHNVIQKFQLVGGTYEYVCEIGGYGGGCVADAGSPTFIEPVGIAVDAHGNLYVSDYGNEVVDEFTDTGADVRQITGSGIALERPSGLAFDSQGDLYVQQYRGGKVLKFAANLLGEVEPTEEPTVFDAGPAYGVAVDSHTGEVYVAHESSVVEYSPSGALEGEFGSGVIGEAYGIAVNSTTDDVYVADARHDDVEVFGAPPAQPPSVGSEYVRDVTPTSALLTTQVSANGFDTHCYFEYGTTTSYSEGDAPALPGIDIGSNGGPGSERAVEALLSGLTPGTTYHYRVVAVNSNGNGEVSYGLDHEFTTFAAGAPSALPDGRAWELVSPPEKNNGNVLAIGGDSGGGLAQASAEGNAVTFLSFAAFPGSQSNAEGNQYVANRELEGWSTSSIDPAMNAQTYENGHGVPYTAFSSNLSSGLLFGGFSYDRQGVEHGVENPPLPESGDPPGYETYYRSTIADGKFESLLTSEPSVPSSSFTMGFVDATPDLKHIVIRSVAALAQGATEGPNNRLYEWTEGQFQLISVLPDGMPEDGVARIGNGLPDPRAISSDGSRVIWSSPAEESQSLFVREGIGTPQARTVPVDLARGGPGSGGGSFQIASSGGSKVFFTDRRHLTDVATNATGVGEIGGDLYEFELEPGNPEGGQLLDLTPDHVDPSGAEVQGVLGEGESKAGGAYVYFVAQGVLAEGAAEGADNLYVLHEDPTTHGWTTTFIAMLSPSDSTGDSKEIVAGEAQDWTFDSALRTTRVTPDGMHLVFMSDRSLTGSDNTVATGASCGIAANGEPLPANCEEVFLYDAADGGSVSCVSCNPTGERPTGPSSIPGATVLGNGEGIYQSRVISEDGSRVFFESYDGLVPQDTNDGRDVYEYEAGRPYLLSGGMGDSDASFIDASANGDDVFFITATSLVPQDTDGLVELYDARAPHVPGEAVGFTAPAVPVKCGGEGECRPPAMPAAPLVGAPSSATFSGLASVVSDATAGQPRTAVQIRAEELAKALKSCRAKHKGHKRAVCEAQARKRFDPRAKAKKSSKPTGR